MSQRIKRAVFTAVVVSFLLVPATFADQNGAGRGESNWLRDIPRQAWTWLVDRTHDLVHIADVISLPTGTPTLSSGGQ